MIDPEGIWTYRACPSRVVDPVTVELLVDLGLGFRAIRRFRIYGLDAPEGDLVDPVLGRTAAGAAGFIDDWFQQAVALNGEWPLLVSIHKDRRTANEFLAEVWNWHGEGLVDVLAAVGLAGRAGSPTRSVRTGQPGRSE